MVETSTDSLPPQVEPEVIPLLPMPVEAVAKLLAEVLLKSLVEALPLVEDMLSAVDPTLLADLPTLLVEQLPLVVEAHPTLLVEPLLLVVDLLLSNIIAAELIPDTLMVVLESVLEALVLPLEAELLAVDTHLVLRSDNPPKESEAHTLVVSEPLIPLEALVVDTASVVAQV